MKIDLYMDLQKIGEFINDKNSLYANATPMPKVETMDRIKITVNLPDAYFEQQHDKEAIVEDVKTLSDSLHG